MSLTNGITLAPLLVDIKADVAQFKNDMAETSATGMKEAKSLSGNISGEADKIGEKLSGMGEKFSKFVTVPILAAGVALGKVAFDTENDLSSLGGRLGATKEETEQLKEVAMSVYKDGFGESLGACVDDLVILQQNLKETSSQSNEMKKDTLEQISTMKTLFGVETAELTKTLATMKNNGIIKDTQEGLDIITAGFQNGANASDDFLDTLWEYSPQFAKLGIDGKTATNIIVSGLKAGAFNADKMGDAIKEFSIRAVDGSKTTIDGFTQIGLSAEGMANNFSQGGTVAGKAFTDTIKGLQSMQDPIKQNQAGTELFGTMWEDLGKTAIFSMAGVNDSLGDVSGATKKAGEEMNNSIGSQFTTTLRETKEAFLPLGVEVLNLAKDNLPMFRDIIKDITEFLAGMNGGTKKSIVQFGILAATLGPVLSTGGKLISTFGKIGGAISGIGAASEVAVGTASAGGLASMVSGLGSLAGVAGPVGVGLAVVGAGLYVAHENAEYMNTSLSTTAEELPLLQRGLNALNGHTIKSKEEMQAMGLIYEDWNSNISQDTIKSLEDTAQSVRDLNFDVQKSNITKSIITEESANDLIARTDKLCKDVIQTIENNKSESVKGLTELFNVNGIQDYEEIVLSSLDSLSAEEEAKVKENQDNINAILNKAKDDKREIQASEKIAIEEYLNNIANIKLNSVAKSNDELLSAQASFTSRLKGMDEQGISEMLQSESSSRDEKNRATEVQYNTEIEKLKLKWNDMNYGERVAAEKAIKELETDRDAKIKLNDDTYKGYLKTLEEQYPEIYNKINYFNGKILNSNELSTKAELDTQIGMFATLGQISETGYYQLYNENRQCWENVYVDIDKETGKVTSLWNQTTGQFYGNPLEPKVTDIDTTTFNRVRLDYDKLKGYLIRNPLGASFYIKYNQQSYGYGYDSNGNPINYNYNGQDYVPYDGYTARLHKGERVLTAKENEQYTQNAKEPGAANNIVVNSNLFLDGEKVATNTDRINGNKINLERRNAGLC